MPDLRSRLHYLSGRIGLRLLAVNLLVVLVPLAGLEFARVYERQLLESLERDMANQAALSVRFLEDGLAREVPLGDSRHGAILARAAVQTRTRIRLLGPEGVLLGDSHREGPPEGPEPPPPSMFPGGGGADHGPDQQSSWPEVSERREVDDALAGSPSSRFRVSHKAVFLFVARPIRADGVVAGVVYVTRSTRPVLADLYQVRTALIQLGLGALCLGAMLSLGLAWSISRPLAKLSNAAARITRGERHVEVPIGGSGEIRELGASFRAMTDQLGARQSYISDFAADVAHEFKSPLTSIRGAAELLADGMLDRPDARGRFLRNIELDVGRLDRLVSRLLELSRIEANQEPLVTIDFDRLLARVVARLGSGPTPIELDYQATDVFVPARERDLEAAVTNLLENAIRFSPPGAAVGLRVTQSSGGLAVTVSDQGPGIAEAQRDKVFERFFTTEGAEEGTGLGLAIVHSVAVAHGGGIAIRSSPAGGTAMVLTLPLAR